VLRDLNETDRFESPRAGQRKLKKFSAGNHYTNATDVISGLKTERAKDSPAHRDQN